MRFDTHSIGEWRRGWRTVLGAMMCSGFGIPLFYYVFSLFLEGMRAEFQVGPGEMANAQALIVVGALVAPLMGRWLDRFGFRRVFLVSSLILVATFAMLATVVSTLASFAVMALLIGAAGIGGGPLAYTRPVTAWFWHSRGLALGMAAIGLAITTAIASPLLARLIAAEGWRAGYIALALVMLFVCIPATLFLMRDTPPEGPAGPAEALTGDDGAGADGDRSPVHTLDFWLLCASIMSIAVAGAGLVSQISPIMQDEGISQINAAYGVTAYALGQVAGRIVAGWYLDRSNPRVVAFFFTAIPALGFAGLAAFSLPIWGAVIAVALVGIQQGAEIDLFAWFVARRFGFARYGAVYGWIIAFSWIGNASGILAFGWIRDLAGSYVMAEWLGAALLLLGAVLIAGVNVRRITPD